MQSVVLGKHKYYCEMCKKQCRDENAFRQHKHSSFHQQRMMEFHTNPQQFIERYSKEFLDQFNEIFRIKFGYSGFIPATKAYNEYIKDPHHTHLNSTKWANLSEFAQYLQDETDLYEISRELTGVSASGEKNQEQLMIKMIDKNQNAKEGMNERDRKEHMRELEKRREEKDLEKMIKKANKMQAELEKKKQLKEDNTSQSLDQSEIKTDQNFSGFNLDLSSNAQTASNSN